MINSANVSRLTISLAVNGADREITLDVRTTLLDLLREGLHLTGVKKGCDPRILRSMQCPDRRPRSSWKNMILTSIPLGVKGLGEVAIVGVAPAIANAMFHATGRRVREFPITLEKLL